MPATWERARPTRLPRVAPLAAVLAALVVGLALLLAGCGAGMSGTYAAEGGAESLEFQRDGRVYVTTFGGTFACTYEVDGEHVIVKGPNGSQVMRKAGDRLEGGLGRIFVKRAPDAPGG